MSIEGEHMENDTIGFFGELVLLGSISLIKAIHFPPSLSVY